MNPLEIVAIGFLGVMCIIAIASFLTASRVATPEGNGNRYSSSDNIAGFSAGAYSHSSSGSDGCGLDGGGGGDC